MIYIVIPVILLLMLSAFFSASETSFFSLSKVNLKELENKSPKIYRRIRFLLEHPTSFVATILIGNECATVLVSNLLANYFHSIIHSSFLVVFLNMVTALPLILIFGEITPRIFAAKQSMAVAKACNSLVWFFYRLFLPLRILIEVFVNTITRLLGVKPREFQEFDESDFLGMVEDSKRTGAIGESEQELIENIFYLDDDKAIDIATSITDYFSVHKEDLIHNIIPMVKDNEIYRIPVIGDFPNQVVGVLYTKDLLTIAYRPDDHTKVAQLMKEPFFIAPDAPLEKVFKRLRQLRVHIAFLANDNKTVTGVVTMEDILEQIFGEIWEGTEDKPNA